ncbi:MAG TPA: cation:proton antiporter [Methanomicrobia archaeon]|nr:cation:proton antiporter [Methanomicrobia archaeon]
MDLILDIAILLLAAKVGGELSEYAGYPSIIGELAGGIIVGTSVLGLIGDTSALERFADIGILLLMFLAGAETNLQELTKSAGSSVAVAISGVVFPFTLGYLAAVAFGYGASEGMFLGAALTATSVSITVRALFDIEKLNTRKGMTILGAAIIDDVIGVVIFTLVVGLAVQGELSALLVVEVIGAIIAFFLLSHFVVRRVMRRLFKYTRMLRTAEGTETFVIVFVLLFALFAEEAYIAGITGSFLAGIMLAQTHDRNTIIEKTKTVGYAFFIPLFFAFVGSRVDIWQILDVGAISVVVIVFAIVGKMGGSAIACKAIGMKIRDGLEIGIGMTPRMEVAIVIANAALTQGVFSVPLYTSVVMMSFATTLMTPPLIKKFFT